jgi:hypothetical protein
LIKAIPFRLLPIRDGYAYRLEGDILVLVPSRTGGVTVSDFGKIEGKIIGKTTLPEALGISRRRPLLLGRRR